MAQRGIGTVNIVDETFIDAPPYDVAAVLLHPVNLATAWPHVALTTAATPQPPPAGSAAEAGTPPEVAVAWTASGAMEGTFTLHVSPFWDGAMVRHEVLATAPGGQDGRVARAHSRRWKRHVTAVKDRLEPRRRAWRVTGGESIHSQGEVEAGPGVPSGHDVGPAR